MIPYSIIKDTVKAGYAGVWTREYPVIMEQLVSRNDELSDRLADCIAIIAEYEQHPLGGSK